MNSEQKYWLSFWALMLGAATAITWAVAWATVSYQRDRLAAGLVPRQVPAHYETIWVPKDAPLPEKAR